MRAKIFPSAVLLPMLRRASGTNSREAGRVRFLPGLLLPLLLVLTGDVDGVSAQGAPPLITPVVTPIELPYTVIDDESRTRVQVGAEAPLRGNGPLTGYAYLFLTRPHFLDEHLYLRALIAPVYATGEVIRNHWPTTHSALGFGLGGGLFAAGYTEFQNGGLDKAQSFAGNVAEATLAYYLRGPKIARVLPLEAQIRVRPTYVMYNRKDDTSDRFRLPEDSMLYRVRAGIRLGGVPPDLSAEFAAELSLWHQLSYRATAGRYGLPEQPQETEHLTQETWIRLGGIYSFWGTQASAFLNAGIAEDTDALSTFRLGGGLRLRAEFPYLLHGYYVDEISARRFWLVNLAYRFPLWPGQDRVKLQFLADYARVDYLPGHSLPHSGLAGVGADLSVALTKRITLVAGYGYGIDAPRGGGFGGHEVNTLFEYKY
jgi:hypothetical protein